MKKTAKNTTQASSKNTKFDESKSYIERTIASKIDDIIDKMYDEVSSLQDDEDDDYGLDDNTIVAEAVLKGTITFNDKLVKTWLKRIVDQDENIETYAEDLVMKSDADKAIKTYYAEVEAKKKDSPFKKAQKVFDEKRDQLLQLQQEYTDNLYLTSDGDDLKAFLNKFHTEIKKFNTKLK